MARMVYAETFLSKRAEVSSTRLRSRIDEMLRTIEQMPGVGSALVTRSIRRRYGNNILKAIVSPYLIIYRYDRINDAVYVYDLVYARASH